MKSVAVRLVFMTTALGVLAYAVLVLFGTDEAVQAGWSCTYEEPSGSPPATYTVGSINIWCSHTSIEHKKEGGIDPGTPTPTPHPHVVDNDPAPDGDGYADDVPPVAAVSGCERDANNDGQYEWDADCNWLSRSPTTDDRNNSKVTNQTTTFGSGEEIVRWYQPRSNAGHWGRDCRNEIQTENVGSQYTRTVASTSGGTQGTRTNTYQRQRHTYWYRTSDSGGLNPRCIKESWTVEKVVVLGDFVAN